MDSFEVSYKEYDLVKCWKVEGFDYYKGRERKEEWEEIECRYRLGKLRKIKVEKDVSLVVKWIN